MTTTATGARDSVVDGATGWLIGEVQMRLSFENNAVVVVQVVDGQVGGDGSPLLQDAWMPRPMPWNWLVAKCQNDAAADRTDRA